MRQKNASKKQAVDPDHGYGKTLEALQIELVKFQKHLIAKGDRILILLEGRDSAGKDGTIKRVIEHLSPRDTRVVALNKPSTRDESEWYFQRYVPYLPAAEEFVLFNRSWYNRAGVEWVMGFCTEAQYEEFMETVPTFEQMLVRSGIQLFKYYLDIDKAEQKQRLKDRLTDPLKQWKMSPIDAAAQKHWKGYSTARNAMFARTHTPTAPWTIVRANDKKQARLNLIMDLLTRLDYKHKDHALLCPDPDVVFNYTHDAVAQGRVAA
jgi:polyphosphate kinase 2